MHSTLRLLRSSRKYGDQSWKKRFSGPFNNQECGQVKTRSVSEAKVEYYRVFLSINNRVSSRVRVVKVSAKACV